MLTTQRIEPIRVQLYDAEVAEKVTITARTQFMLAEMKKLFQEEKPPETGCNSQEND